MAHVAGAEWGYVSSVLGSLPGHGRTIKAIEEAGPDPWEALAGERETVMARLFP